MQEKERGLGGVEKLEGSSIIEKGMVLRRGGGRGGGNRMHSTACLRGNGEAQTTNYGETLDAVVARDGLYFAPWKPYFFAGPGENRHTLSLFPYPSLTHMATGTFETRLARIHKG